MRPRHDCLVASLRATDGGAIGIQLAAHSCDCFIVCRFGYFASLGGHQGGTCHIRSCGGGGGCGQERNHNIGSNSSIIIIINWNPSLLRRQWPCARRSHFATSRLGRVSCRAFGNSAQCRPSPTTGPRHYDAAVTAARCVVACCQYETNAPATAARLSRNDS